MSEAKNWDDWLAQFEQYEKKQFGYTLEGVERDSTLEELFEDGYSPERAFELVKAGAKLEKYGALAPMMLIGTIFSLIALVLNLFSGTEVTGVIILLSLFGTYFIGFKMKARRVVKLARASHELEG